jgi:hypothetical protein
LLCTHFLVLNVICTHRQFNAAAGPS